jgi:hypothetical protein
MVQSEQASMHRAARLVPRAGPRARSHAQRPAPGRRLSTCFLVSTTSQRRKALLASSHTPHIEALN